jgi:hypothetical protein
MAQSSSRFVWSDAWLLLALLYAREPADRETIIKIGDFINHAIFTDEELEGGLQRLFEAGYVIKHDGRFSPSPSVVAWFERISPPRSYVHKDWQRVERFLGLPPHS